MSAVEGTILRNPRNANRSDRQQSLSERVAAALGRRIVSGVHKPGETLPTEPRIQEEFGVSRTAVREAIRLLSAKGLTASRPKTGTRVRPMADWNMLDSDVLGWHLDEEPSQEFIQSLFEMREIIEPTAAALAAERATPKEIEAIEAAMSGIEREDRGSPAQIRADVDFHMGLLEASHNPILRSVGGLIESALGITFSISWKTAMASHAVLQHRAVLEAVRTRKPEDAYVSMRRLIKSARGDVFDVIWMNRTGDTRAYAIDSDPPRDGA